MKRFRPRLTVRAMILLVAVVALGLFVWTEFRDGSPPRFVLRGIPARIARLRPGMGYQETHDILGLDRPWWQGGASARPGKIMGNANIVYETYYLREEQTIVQQASVGGVPPGPVQVWVPPAVIHLQFMVSPGSSMFAESAMQHEGIKLVGASYSGGPNGQRAEMPLRP